MVRVEFETLEQATAWINKVVLLKEYDCYYTLKGELIFVPVKSTRPTVYGYIKYVDKDRLRKLWKDNLQIYTINRFEWNAERDLPKEYEKEVKVKDYISEELKSLASNVVKPKKSTLSPGATVWKTKNVYIKANILEELKIFYFNNVWHMTQVGKNCIRKYYPRACQKTIDTRLYNYSRYAVNNLLYLKQKRKGRFGYEFRFTPTLIWKS